MLGISTPELIAVLVIALIFLGPKRLPEIARTIGKGLRELRNAMRTLNAAMEADEPTAEPPEDTATIPAPEPRPPRLHDSTDVTTPPGKPTDPAATRSQP